MKWILAFVVIVVLFFCMLLILSKPKLPVSMVVLHWDYDKATHWLDENKDFMEPRNSGMTLLHDIAQYRKYFKKKDTDYEKLRKLITYYIDHGGSPCLKNNGGLTAYDIALQYDVYVAEMIKKEMKAWEDIKSAKSQGKQNH